MEEFNVNIKGLVIGDIHFGIDESERLYEELNKLVIQDIRDNDYNYIILNGDTFDKKITLNEHAAVLAITFMSTMMEISAQKKTKVRILQGTKTHDLNQIQIFAHYSRDPKYNFDIITKVKEEELFDGFNVLYIPEESLENQFEYYKSYKTPERYDMIFGHGTWSFKAFSNQIEVSNDNKVSSSPVLIEDEWIPTLKKNGKIIFGHIHEKNIHSSQRIIYPGSFTTWTHGYGNLKGYVRVIHTEEETRVIFANNTLTPTYETVHINASDMTVDELLEIIESKKTIADRISFKISNIEKEFSKVILRNYEKEKRLSFSFEISNTLLESQKMSEEMDEFVKKYSYILQNKISVEEMVQRFMKEDMNIDIQLDFIKECLKEVVDN